MISTQHLTSLISSTMSTIILSSTHDNTDKVSDHYTTSIDETTLSIDTVDKYSIFSTSPSLIPSSIQLTTET